MSAKAGPRDKSNIDKDYDRKADRQVATKTKVQGGINGEESSDQKHLVKFGDTDETDNLFQTGGENDFNEFENFMNGISSKIKHKENAKKLKI